MTDAEWKALGFQTDSEFEENFKKIKSLEDKGSDDILKYFDRIHDKCFSLNNILIAGYFALVTFINEISYWILVIPSLNSFLLIYLDYRMMERARIQAQITYVNGRTRKKYGVMQQKTNLYSLLSILSTVLVVAFLIYILIKR